MTLDQLELSRNLPSSIREATELCRSIRRSPEMLATEDIVLLSAGCDFQTAFKCAIALKRLKDRGASVDAYLAAVAKLEQQ